VSEHSLSGNTWGDYHRCPGERWDQQYAHAVAETSYASCGDLSLAYQLFGDGPVELVFAGSFVSHVELFWTLPEFEAFFEQLSTFCRVLLFDKAGVGLSDPVPKVRTLDDRAAEIEAVMDAVGFRKAVLFGVSEGGPAAMVFAATRPWRTRALILAGTFAYNGVTGWDDIDRDAEELRARLVPEVGEDYTPSTEQLARWQEMLRAGRSAWGSGATLKGLLPSVGSKRQLAMLERMSASPGMARATAEALFRVDVRPVLPTISAPTLVIHAREDPISVQGGRYLADHIPGARWLEVDGTDHAPWFTDPDAITSGIEEFLTGSHAAPSQSHRALRSVLFTDMVASTQHAAVAGDERWRAVLHRFGEITAELTQRFGGTVVKSTGDGHLTPFDGPTQAIRCAEALRADAETLGIEIRVGIHTGECELLDADIEGIAVHIAARIRPARVKSSSPAPCVTWSSARAPASRTAAASSCVVCPGPGNSWRSIATARGRDRPRRNWRRHPPPDRGRRCAARTAPWR
jgi:pimeloyl-ACP methyl ester carboxylesterase